MALWSASKWAMLAGTIGASSTVYQGALVRFMLSTCTAQAAMNGSLSVSVAGALHAVTARMLESTVKVRPSNLSRACAASSILPFSV